MQKSVPVAVELRRVVKIYDDAAALDGVSPRFDGGSIHAVMGQNGAGKTTLLNILSGVEQPTSGEILLNGEPLRLRSPHDAVAAGIRMASQENTFADELSVAENMLFYSLDRKSVV